MKLPRWVDFHCHLDLYEDHAALIRECDGAGIAVLTVTTTPKAWARNREVAQGSEHVRVALGLHPQLVDQRGAELPLFERLLPEARYVGEIGLDAGPRFYRTFADQERIFTRILALCAEHGDKILTVHSVRAVGRVLEHLERHLPPDRGGVVLHWFTGTFSEADRAAKLGCYFSVNGEMLRSEKHRALVRKLPQDRLLTETDGPFVELDGRPSRPRDVARTVDALANVLGLGTEAMAARVVKNLATLVTDNR